MADVFSKRKRSEVMSRIRSRGSKDTELALAKLLRRHRATGWRRHVQVRIAERGLRNREFRTSHSALRVFTVRPDFVFRTLRTAIFVDGRFWHGCPRHATKPKNNRVFWRRKLAANRRRDALVNVALRRSGWRVLRIWECELAKRPDVCVRRIERALKSSGDAPVAGVSKPVHHSRRGCLGCRATRASLPPYCGGSRHCFARPCLTLFAARLNLPGVTR